VVSEEEEGAGNKFGSHGSVKGKEELGLKESELGRQVKGRGEGSSETEGKEGKSSGSSWIGPNGLTDGLIWGWDG